MQALFAQAPAAPQVDYYTMLVPAGPVGIISSLSGLVMFVCFILVVIKMFQHGQVGLGIVSIITALCFIGFLITLAYGWMKAKDWNLQTVMLIYTVATVLYIALGGYAYSTAVAVPR